MAFRTIQLLNVRLAFAGGLTEKSSPVEGAEKKYNAKFLIPKDDPQITKINAVLLDLAKEAWGSKAENMLRVLRDDKAFILRDGDKQISQKTGEVKNGFTGCYYIAATNNRDQGDEQAIIFLPSHSNKTADAFKSLDDVKRVFRSGDYVNVIVNAYTLKVGNPGIFGFIKLVQHWKKGESLGGGGEVDSSMLPESAFEPVTDQSTDFQFDIPGA